MANPHIKVRASDLSQPLTKCHPATLPQPQPSPGVLAPQGTLRLEVKDLEQQRSGSGWGRGFGRSRKSVRSLLSALDGGSHTKVLDGLYTALSPHALPRDRLCWQLPFFHNKHGVGVQLPPTADPTGAGCGIGFPACTHHCCPGLSLELLRCSTDPLGFKHWGGFPAGKRAPLSLGLDCSWPWDFWETPPKFPTPGATHGHFPWWELKWAWGSRLPPSTQMGKCHTGRNHRELQRQGLIIGKGRKWGGRCCAGAEGGERNRAAPSSATDSPAALGKATSLRGYQTQTLITPLGNHTRAI